MNDAVIAASKCPVCAGAESVAAFNKNGYTLARCRSCGLLYVDPMPSLEALRAHYQNPDYFQGCEEQGYRSYADMEKALRPHFLRRLRRLAERYPARGRLLDFGCAAGYFLKLARSEGWHIAGIELSGEMARNAARDLGIPIWASLDTLPDREFNAITLWEVIEHLPEPVDTMRQLFDRLRPGGILMVSTPNNGHWQAIREPSAWIGYRPPSHLLYFDAHTLADMLRRIGFERIEIRRVAPLPPLPGWLRRVSAPLQHRLANGMARPWLVALSFWRVIRLLGWGWQKIAHPRDDIFATLEAVARRPQ
jgi:2-polyprenyl-3-methyl-5-hydroxy-6-metoxy-1,4-benzoquinol methylase